MVSVPPGFSDDPCDPQCVINFLSQVRDLLIILGVILAGIVIVLAGWRILLSGGNEEKIHEGKRTLFWGLVGLAVILSVFAIINFVIFVVNNRSLV